MRKKAILTSAIIGSLIVSGIVAASGSTSQPGSADDPLVTKSYVDQLIESKLKGITAPPSTPPTTGTNPSPAAPPELNPPDQGGMKTEALQPGDKIIGFAGTQFIVRTGNVRAVAGEKGDGLPDVTAGKDIKGGQPVSANHLILIPRSDGRGLAIAANSPEAWIMITGPYQIIRQP